MSNLDKKIHSYFYDFKMLETMDKMEDLIYAEPEKSFKTLKQILEKVENEPEKIKAQLYISLYYKQQSEYDEAIDKLTNILQKSKKSKNYELIGNTHLLLGKTHGANNQFHKAVEHLNTATNIFEAVNDKSAIAKSTLLVGSVYRILGNFEKSLENLQTALKIQKELNHKDKMAHCYNDIGVLYNDFRNYDKALESFHKALNINEKSKDESYFITLTNLGNVYFYLQDNEKALKYYKMSLDQIDQEKEKYRFSQIINNIGCLYFQMNKFDKAKDCLSKTLELKNSLKDKKGISSVLTNLGEIEFNKNNYDKALEYVERSLKIKKEIDHKPGIAYSYNNIASLLLKKDELDNVEDVLSKALKIAEKIGENNVIMNIYNNFVEYYKKTENHKKAYEYHVKFTETKDLIFNKKTREKIAEIETKYETEKKEKELEIYKLKNIDLAQKNSQLKLSYEKLKKAQAAIIELEKKNSALSMAVTANHELNQPLQIIKGNFEMFLNEVTENNISDKAKKYLNTIDASLEKIHNILEKMRYKYKLDLDKYQNDFELLFLTDD